MAAESPLARSPYFFVGPRPYCETELAAYIRREHRRGRDLADILQDGYVHRRGGEQLVRAILRRPSLIRALGDDVADAIRVQESELAGRLRTAPSSSDAGEAPAHGPVARGGIRC